MTKGHHREGNTLLPPGKMVRGVVEPEHRQASVAPSSPSSVLHKDLGVSGSCLQSQVVYISAANIEALPHQDHAGKALLVEFSRAF